MFCVSYDLLNMVDLQEPLDYSISFLCSLIREAGCLPLSFMYPLELQKHGTAYTTLTSVLQLLVCSSGVVEIVSSSDMIPLQFMLSFLRVLLCFVMFPLCMGLLYFIYFCSVLASSYPSCSVGLLQCSSPS